jgi:3D-(3,5/4)-trihydroxycyclohexane-1,2-dione acylhydrolase (decyclizing)
VKTRRLTTAQAIIQFLLHQQVERDGKRHRFFAGCFGIFGHGNVAGIGEALLQYPELRYYQCRNEQAMVHTASAFAKMSNRLRTFVCTTSIGPGATNMVTGAATATVNRLPVLLLPGDIFARRNTAPVLQQLEQPGSQDASVNDCLRPVSRYWDRINRPEQIITALPEAMRVLTSPAETGAVTLALPQDVQAEAFDCPAALLEDRVWHVRRPAPDAALCVRALEWIRAARRPLIIAGGGLIYSEATAALARLVERTGVPVAETHAGKGSLPDNHPQCLGALGVSGTRGANVVAGDADLVIGIGTRYSDVITSSKTAFQNPKVRFININVAEFDAYKHAALPLVADARVALEALSKGLQGYRVSTAYREKTRKLNREWDAEVSRFAGAKERPPVSQAAVIGAVNEFSRPRDVVVCAAGTLPGDLHKLWRTRSPNGYHIEYGYSCMGYEIAGGLGVKMAAPDRDVYVMVGDGSYLMMSQEIITSIQEGYKLTIVLLNNHGFSSISGLSQTVGCAGFGARYRYRNSATGQLDGKRLPVDFAANAASLGAHVIEATDVNDLRAALREARKQTRTTVIVIETDPEKRVPGYESWWDVPVSEIAQPPAVRAARKRYVKSRARERYFL